MEPFFILERDKPSYTAVGFVILEWSKLGFTIYESIRRIEKARNLPVSRIRRELTQRLKELRKIASPVATSDELYQIDCALAVIRRIKPTREALAHGECRPVFSAFKRQKYALDPSGGYEVDDIIHVRKLNDDVGDGHQRPLEFEQIPINDLWQHAHLLRIWMYAIERVAQAIELRLSEPPQP